MWKLDLGANFLPDGRVQFRVWAPLCSQVEVKILGGRAHRILPLVREEDYFSGIVSGLSEEDTYVYVLDGKKARPDPASRFQPAGVHGPSAIVNPGRFSWQDAAWRGIDFEDLIFYELHTGTFTPRGTFDAAIKKIPYLKKLGITCVEILPVAQFSGKRNWGYDGVDLFAVQNSYGGPEGLKKFVNACHRHGLAVCLDVVYNHFGPEGNYLSDYGPYLTQRYHTPWGAAVNYDGAHCDGVRHFVVSNVRYWISEFHIDLLRLDAVHGIFDFSARHILTELTASVRELAAELGRKVWVIGESDLNDSKVIRPEEKCGYGLDGQWSDDFHHSVHAFLTGERSSYYQDFGRLSDIAKALREGFVYDGRYSKFRKRRHGNSARGLSPRKHVVCVQNHDQVGNRAVGDRLSRLVSFERQKLAAVLLLLSPNTPLIFMGQEYGETAPFLYFVDHLDPQLRDAVREGRQREFMDSGAGKVPDPCAESTFRRSRLNWELITSLPLLSLRQTSWTDPCPTAGTCPPSGRRGRAPSLWRKKPGGGTRMHHFFLWKLYRDLILFRKNILQEAKSTEVKFDEAQQWLALRYQTPRDKRIGALISFAAQGREVNPFPEKKLKVLLHTEAPRYGGRCKIKHAQFLGKISLPPLCAMVGELI